MFEFDLIYSEDLGECTYSDRILHCCFNIYKRPVNGLNKQIRTKLKDVKIVRQDSKQYNEIVNYDIYEALNMKKPFDDEMYEVANTTSI